MNTDELKLTVNLLEQHGIAMNALRKIKDYALSATIIQPMVAQFLVVTCNEALNKIEEVGKS